MSMAFTARLNNCFNLASFDCALKYRKQCSLSTYSAHISSTLTSIHRHTLSRKHRVPWNSTSLQCNTRTPTKIQCTASQDPLVSGTGLHNYEFTDDAAEVELRIPLPGETNLATEDVFVNVQDTSLVITVQVVNEVKVLLSIDRLYSRINPPETIWYIDENDLVVSLKKSDVDVKWPDIMEAWHSLGTGVSALLKGTSVYLVGDSSEINWAVARELAVSLEYTPLQTGLLLEQATEKSIDNLLIDEGEDSVAEAEAAILESINIHVRLAVATLGGIQGATSRPEKWKKLHAGFTIWLSQSEAKDEASAEEEARRAKENQSQAYAGADVVVKLGGWDTDAARPAAEGCLRALKYLIESDKELPGKKSLYVRMGCRGDWPNIMPPGQNVLHEKDVQAAMSTTS
ncbi:hypothetical protein SUGI_0190630 [Cryptomeria japonica]|uniref:probable inactive shikimate kinase like 2, chloroplastic n=1 Tax=Cryptomeria japonica TaxID=3369 RepID=UPI002408AA83|nr:probable inactive shikimate kinase like 2, chloroplastic [Cryptomeria japonica]GLJ12419.1 hypothetical protein SUGI_0190630 [Cryptomeria japonica]